MLKPDIKALVGME